MLRFMAKYADGIAKQRGLDIRFQAILPMQVVGGTGIGDVAAGAYAHALGLEREV
jgi:sugar/nucleoside kinase (ribokinase family)